MRQAYGSHVNPGVALAATEESSQLFRGIALAMLVSAVPWALIGYVVLR